MSVRKPYSSSYLIRTYLAVIGLSVTAFVFVFWMKLTSPTPESLVENTSPFFNTELTNYSLLPLPFIPNLGQFDDKSVQFIIKNQDYAILFTPSAVMFNFSRPTTNGKKVTEIVHLQFEGANPTPKIESADHLPGVVNFFRGNDPTQWQTSIPTYEKIIYRSLYPGIDLAYSGKTGLLKSEFIVSPHADPTNIRLVYSGFTALKIRVDGALLLSTDHGELVETAPVLYQDISGQQVSVAGTYQLFADGQVGFQIENYDPDYPLIIDPVMVYGSYLGGNSTERGNAIAIDDSKNIYVVGTTMSDDFPVVNAFDATYNGGVNGDVFVAKLDPTGSTLVYATYLGGSESDLGFGIAADATGNAYVVGQTDSEDFPLSNSLDNECGSVVNGVPHIGCPDTFVAKLNSTGNVLLYSTYVGGNGIDRGADIVLDEANNAYLSGYTESTDFPTTPDSFQPDANFAIRGSSSDSFVAKIAVDGSSLVYATYLGGSGLENIGANPGPSAIAVDGQGQVAVTGHTVSDDFPVLNAAQPTYGGGSTPSVGGDAFVVKLTADGSDLLFATYLGGSADENSAGNSGIAVDSNDNILVTGYTGSGDFPVQNAWQSLFGGGLSDAFVVKYASNGTIQYATYLGGDSLEYGYGIDIDSLGNSYIVGATFSNNFPTIDPISGQCVGGVLCGFITQLNSGGSDLIYSSYLGGSNGNNTAYDVVVDTDRAAYVIVTTSSSNFTTVSPVQPQNNGGFDAFIVKIALEQYVYLPMVIKSQ